MTDGLRRAATHRAALVLAVVVGAGMDVVVLRASERQRVARLTGR